METLPPEVLSHILEKTGFPYGSLRRVCRLWYDLVDHFSRDIDVLVLHPDVAHSLSTRGYPVVYQGTLPSRLDILPVVKTWELFSDQ